MVSSIHLHSSLVTFTVLVARLVWQLSPTAFSQGVVGKKIKFPATDRCLLHTTPIFSFSTQVGITCNNTTSMAQGSFKMSSKAKAPKAVHSKRQASKKVTKSKTKAGQAVDKTHKKFTSGLTAKTEALLGERVGHLELIGKGKKADKKLGITAGSKKFG